MVGANWPIRARDLLLLCYNAFCLTDSLHQGTTNVKGKDGVIKNSIPIHIIIIIIVMIIIIIIIRRRKRRRIIIIIKVNYNLHKKISQNPLRQFYKKLYNSENLIRRRLSDHSKITFAIKYLLMSHLRWWRHQSRDYFRIRFLVAVTRFH